MSARNYSNTFAETTLTGSISNSATSITIGSTTGLPASFPYTLALDYGTASVEMVTVTALAGSTLTVTRGQDGTSAQAHNAGARVVHPVTARDLSEPQQHMNASADIHGLSGGAAVVGTSQAQTLTNKTISGASNTLSNIPNSALVAIDAAKVTQPFTALTATGAVSGASVAATGAVTAGSATVTGTVSAATVSATTVTATGAVSGASVAATGAATAARSTVTGTDGTNQVVTVVGDEVSRTKPIATWKRGGLGLVVGEDATVQATGPGLVVDPTQRASGAAAPAARAFVKASGVIGLIVQQNGSETQNLIQARNNAGSPVFQVTNIGVVICADSLSVGGNADIAGAVTTGSAGVTVLGEAWTSLTLSGGWSGTLKYRKVAGPGNTVWVLGNITPGTKSDGTTLATLPVGYRPATGQDILLTTNAESNGQSPHINVATTGVMTIWGLAAGTSGASVNGLVSLDF